MMSDGIAAKRYADAFLSYARDTMGFEKGLEDLQNVKRILHDNPDFKEFLESPEIPVIDKCTVVDRVVHDGFSEETRQFMRLLLYKNRVNLLIDIAEYARVAYSHGVEIDALLKTSYPQDTDILQKIRDNLEKKLNKKLHLYVELDANILGGVYAKVGNIVLDGSVRHRLDDLRDKLQALKVV